MAAPTMVDVANDSSLGGVNPHGATCNGQDTTGCGQAPATVTIPATDPAGSTPVGIAVDQATDTIYTADLDAGDAATGTVAVINGASCNGQNTSGCPQTPATIAVGFGAEGVSIDPTTHTVYVNNIEDSSVSWGQNGKAVAGVADVKGRRRVLAAVQVGGVAAGGVDAIDEADSDARNVVELLDVIPGAYARAQLASASPWRATRSPSTSCSPYVARVELAQARPLIARRVCIARIAHERATAAGDRVHAECGDGQTCTRSGGCLICSGRHARGLAGGARAYARKMPGARPACDGRCQVLGPRPRTLARCCALRRGGLRG
jgi:hypothetical protein